MPESVASRVLKNIFFSESFSVGNGLDLALQRNWVVNRSERVCEYLEFSFLKQCRNVVCKTRSEKCQVARVVDFKIRGREVYFRKKVHMTNLNSKTQSVWRKGLFLDFK